MKALQLANAQGQKVYTITQANADTIIPTLTHSQMTMNDITNAVNAGYTVTTHESPIQVPGWTGSGYIIADQHGNGMYMISGGENGAILILSGTIILWVALLAMINPIVFAAIGGPYGIITLIIASKLMFAAAIALLVGDKSTCNLLFSMAVALLMTVLSVLTGLAILFYIGLFMKPLEKMIDMLGKEPC